MGLVERTEVGRIPWGLRARSGRRHAGAALRGVIYRACWMSGGITEKRSFYAQVNQERLGCRPASMRIPPTAFILGVALLCSAVEAQSGPVVLRGTGAEDCPE